MVDSEKRLYPIWMNKQQAEFLVEALKDTESPEAQEIVRKTSTALNLKMK